MTDVLPYVEKNYRVRTDRASRAIAGLSMGGNHTLLIGIPHLDKFAYIGVYSSGLFGGGPGRGRPGRPGAAAPAAPAPPAPSFEQVNAAVLDNAGLKKGLKLFWFSTGKDDGLLPRTISTVDMFKKHGFSPGLQGKSRRAHVDRLAQLPARVRAAAVSIDPGGFRGFHRVPRGSAGFSSRGSTEPSPNSLRPPTAAADRRTPRGRTRDARAR